MIIKDKTGKKLAHIFDGKDEEKTYVANIIAPSTFETQYFNLADPRFKGVDAIGFGYEVSGTYYVAGAHTGFEVVMFLSGMYKGGVYLYSKSGGNFGYETLGGSLYAFAAHFRGKDKKKITPQSWNGWFSSFSFGIAGNMIGGGYFWGNSGGNVFPFPGVRGNTTWEGVLISSTGLPKGTKEYLRRNKIIPKKPDVRVVSRYKKWATWIMKNTNVIRKYIKRVRKLSKIGSIKYSYSYYGLLGTVYDPRSGIGSVVLGKSVDVKNKKIWSVSVKLEDK